MIKYCCGLYFTIDNIQDLFSLSTAVRNYLLCQNMENIANVFTLNDISSCEREKPDVLLFWNA